VKVLDAAGGGTWASVTQGVVYAADTGVSVSNMSVGGNGGDPALASAVDYAAALDVVQVAAAGNNGNTTYYYPAAYGPVIAVMATDAAGKRAAWSNYGDWCDLCAPGDSVLSLWKGDQTNWLSGTSMSSPHVAGIAALVRTQNGQLDALDTELVIRYSARDLGTAGRDSTYAWGLADLDAAMARANNLSLSTQDAAPGSSVGVRVNRPDRFGDLYVVLPSLSPRDPGSPLSDYFAGDDRVLPLTVDAVTVFSVIYSSFDVFDNFAGWLDASGQALATFNIPAGSYFAGQTVTFTGVTFDPKDLSKPSRVMNSVTLRIR